VSDTYFILRDGAVRGPLTKRELKRLWVRSRLQAGDKVGLSTAGPWQDPLLLLGLVREFTVKQPRLGRGEYRVSYECPGCGAALEAGEDEAGRPDNCPDCGCRHQLAPQAPAEIEQLKTAAAEKQQQAEAEREQRQRERQEKQDASRRAREKQKQAQAAERMSRQQPQATRSKTMPRREFPALKLVVRILIIFRNILIALWAISLTVGLIATLYAVTMAPGVAEKFGALIAAVAAAVGLTLFYGLFALVYWASAELINLALYAAELLEGIEAGVENRRQSLPDRSGW